MLHAELRQLETETFEVEEMFETNHSMMDLIVAPDAELALAATSSSCSCSSCCSCSTSSCCSTSTSTSSCG